MAFEAWGDVFKLVSAETARIAKENPKKSRADCVKAAWKTKAVLDARKQFDAHKAAREKKAKK